MASDAASDLGPDLVRAAIVDAALDLFEVKGFAATTFEDLADHAEISTQALAKHFPSKEAVLFPELVDGPERFRAALASQPLDEPILRRALVAAVAITQTSEVDQRIASRRAALLEQAGPFGDRTTWSSLAVGHRAFEEAIADELGEPADAPAVQLVTLTALLVIRQAAKDWYANGATSDLAELTAAKLAALRDLVNETQASPLAS